MEQSRHPSFGETMQQRPKSSMGCFAKGLIVCAILFVVFVVGGIFTGYYIWNHTSLPAKGIVALLNQIPELQIEGVSGSFSSGFEVKKIRITDESGNVNALDDIRLKYRSEGEDLIITDIHVGRGYFYIDRSDESETTVDTSRQDEPASEELSNSRFIIEKISINDVTVEDVSSGEKFHLEKVELDSLVLGKETSMGKLIVKSTDCDLKILPVDSAKTGQVFTVDGRFKPGLHENLVAEVDVEGKIDITDAENSQVDLKLLGGKVVVKGKGKKMNMRVSELTLTDYFKNAPPLKNIDLEFTHDEESDKAKAVGSFTMWNKPFTIDQEVTLSEAELKEDLIATHHSDGVAYEIRIPSGGESEKLFPPLKVTTKPEMSTQDAVSQLLAGKKYASLTDDDKAEVEKALPYFSAQEKINAEAP